MKPNWFIAFPVNAPAWFAALEKPPAGSRLFHTDDAHATLAFLGAVDEASAFAAFDLATNIGWSPGRFVPGPIHPFGPRRAPSAYAVEPLDGAPWLTQLLAEHSMQIIAAATRKALDSLRLPPPRPHVTVARPGRQATPAQRTALAAWATSQRLPPEPVVIDRLALYTWSADRRARLFDIRATSVAPLPPVGSEPA